MSESIKVAAELITFTEEGVTIDGINIPGNIIHSNVTIHPGSPYEPNEVPGITLRVYADKVAIQGTGVGANITKLGE